MDHLDFPCQISVVVGVLVPMVLTIFLHVLRRSKVGRPKTPPSPAGAWPIVGHLPLLGGTEPLHKTLGAMADKYGPAFTLQIGLNRALVLSSWEMAKDCFTINDVAVSARPKLAVAKHMGYNYAMFGFATHGSYWRKLRKIVTVELLSNRRLELLSHVRVSELETSMEELYKLWKENRNKSGQTLVKLKQWIGDMNLNLTLRMVAGKRYNFSNSTEDHENAKARRCQKAISEFFYLAGLFVVSDAIPFLGWLDLGGHEQAMKRAAKELDSILGGWLEEHKSKRALGEGKGEQDFMDVMLSILDGEDLAADFDSDTINKATCLNVIAAATDTTTVTLTWGISLLLNNRHVLKRAQDELDIQVGKERIVEDSDIRELVYLQAIVKETLRLYPAAPSGTPRKFNEDCIIGGYHVPKGTRLITNIWKIQTDPKIWTDPLEFKPERFFPSDKNFDVIMVKNYALIPFGSGRRVCPGATFALQVVHLTLARILQMFEISTPLNAPVDMTESFGITNMKATPLEVLITPRLPSKLYAFKTAR